MVYVGKVVGIVKSLVETGIPARWRNVELGGNGRPHPHAVPKAPREGRRGDTGAAGPRGRQGRTWGVTSEVKFSVNTIGEALTLELPIFISAK